MTQCTSRCLKMFEYIGKHYYIPSLKNDMQHYYPNFKTDQFDGLKFFFYHTFMRYRKDWLSESFADFTIARLSENIASSGGFQEFIRSLSDEMLNYWIEVTRYPQSKEELVGKINGTVSDNRISPPPAPKFLKDLVDNTRNETTHALTNYQDVVMVLDTLRFIKNKLSTQIYNYNIFTYLYEILKKTGDANNLYEQLEIKCVGDKLRRFVIRDMFFLCEDIPYPQNIKYALPVDVNVDKCIKKMKNMKEGKKVEEDRDKKKKIDADEVSNWILAQSNDFNLDPLKVDAGIWYWCTDPDGKLYELEKNSNLATIYTPFNCECVRACFAEKIEGWGEE